MIDLHDLPSLPLGERLSKSQQYRYLGIAALAIIGVYLLIMLARIALAPTATPAEVLPAGTFRPTKEQVASMAITRAGQADGADQTVATGQIAADDTRGTPVFMPFGGQVLDVYVDTTAPVHVGQPLLKIRTPDFVDARNNLLSALSAEQTATAALKVTEENAKRQQQIYETAGGAYKDFRQSQSDLVSAQSTLRSAQSALGAARDKLAIFGKSRGEINQIEHQGKVAELNVATVLRAPVNGIIATRAVSPGQFVTAGATPPVFTITDPKHVWLIAQLSEGDASLVHVGDTVDVQVPAYPGRQFHARIDNVAAALDPATHRLPVRASIENPDQALKPQMFATFIIKRNASDPSALTLPTSAVIHEGDSARIWIALPNGLLQSRTVTVGDSANGRVKILSGLAAGERVVTAGALFVNEAGTQQ